MVHEPRAAAVSGQMETSVEAGEPGRCCCRAFQWSAGAEAGGSELRPVMET